MPFLTCTCRRCQGLGPPEHDPPPAPEAVYVVHLEDPAGSGMAHCGVQMPTPPPRD